MHDSNGNSDAGGHDHAEDHPATSGGDDRNAPLPVLSRDAALSWARAFTGTMAECAGAVVRPETAVERFYDCVGRRGEVAEDGRFQLFFYVRARLATEAHVAAAVRLARALRANGYQVSGWHQQERSDRPVALDMVHVRQKAYVSAESTGVDEMTFATRTGCLLPPGVRQQRL